MSRSRWNHWRVVSRIGSNAAPVAFQVNHAQLYIDNGLFVVASAQLRKNEEALASIGQIDDKLHPREDPITAGGTPYTHCLSSFSNLRVNRYR